MKKQVALLLATVMTLSLLPVNVFAATNNFVDNRLTVPNETALVEHGMSAFTAGNYLLPKATFRGTSNVSGIGNGTPNYYADGTDLVVPLQREVVAGYELKLTLTNAKWFFRDTTVEAFTRNSANALVKGRTANDDFGNIIDVRTDSTFDTGKGWYEPLIASGKYGVYHRDYYFTSGSAITAIQGVTYHELQYELEVSALDQTVATVRILESTPSTGDYMLRIPLVTYISDSNKEATVTIDGGNSSTVTNQKIIFANTADGKTNTTIKDVFVGRDTFNLETLTINELRVGSILSNEVIRLTLPTGYHFTKNWGVTDGINVGIESGLAWGDGSTGPGTYVGDYNASYYLDSSTYGKGYRVNFGRDSSAVGDKLYQNNTPYGYGTNDQVLLIYLGTIIPSTQLRGTIYIENLKVWADDNAQLPASGQEIEIKMSIDSENSDVDSITAQTITVAKRVDWVLGLKTLNAVPTLVSGRYTGPSWSGMDANDNHKTARVQLYENAANAWWASRTTVLALPATDNSTVKGAKFRKVQVVDQDNVNFDLKNYHAKSVLYSNQAYYGSNYTVTGDIPASNEKGIYLNDGEKHGPITVNDNKITITNLDVNINKKSTINFDLWVSIEYGFGRQTGDLKLSVDPTSTSVTGGSALAENLASVVVAHVIDPIEVTTTVSDVKIGYQYVPTQEIQIKETAAHALLQGKTVKVSISDLISEDLVFANDIKVEVIAGDLKIKNIVATGQGGFTSQSQSWLDNTGGDNGALSFDIDRESNTASTIKISNIGVKVYRTVPVSNKYPYQAVVWGTAVAENYGLVDSVSGRTRTWKSDFNTVGDLKDYLRVISSAEDASSILTQEVRVAVGENYYTVNGKTFSMDAESYISTASNSTMVPVRFVANALGLRDDQILWDDSTKTVTITAPNKVVQFSAGSTKMKINGTEVTMQSPDLKPVSAEIKTINGLGRMYLPFRALGEAFGIPVTWEADTRTAIYNAGANTNVNSSVTNTTPAQ